MSGFEMPSVNPEEERVSEEWELEQKLRKMLHEKGMTPEEIEAEMKRVKKEGGVPATPQEKERRAAEEETRRKLGEQGKN